MHFKFDNSWYITTATDWFCVHLLISIDLHNFYIKTRGFRIYYEYGGVNYSMGLFGHSYRDSQLKASCIVFSRVGEAHCGTWLQFRILDIFSESGHMFGRLILSMRILKLRWQSESRKYT